MKLKPQITINARLVFMFTVAIFSTFIPELYPHFFGDWTCNGRTYLNGNYYGCSEDFTGIHTPTFHWGYRHVLYFWMCLSLFIVQLAYLINTIYQITNK